MKWRTEPPTVKMWALVYLGGDPAYEIMCYDPDKEYWYTSEGVGHRGAVLWQLLPQEPCL